MRTLLLAVLLWSPAAAVEVVAPRASPLAALGGQLAAALPLLPASPLAPYVPSMDSPAMAQALIARAEQLRLAAVPAAHVLPNGRGDGPLPLAQPLALVR